MSSSRSVFGFLPFALAGIGFVFLLGGEDLCDRYREESKAIESISWTRRTSLRGPFGPTGNATSLRTARRGSSVPRPRKQGGTLSRYMLQLYRRRPEADVVRAVRPVHVSGATIDGERILVFPIPPADREETLERAELLATAGTIFRVRILDDAREPNRTRSRMNVPDPSWRAFDVTGAVNARSDGTVRIRASGRNYRALDAPILLLNYRKSRGNDRSRRRRWPLSLPTSPRFDRRSRASWRPRRSHSRNAGLIRRNARRSRRRRHRDRPEYRRGRRSVDKEGVTDRKEDEPEGEEEEEEEEAPQEEEIVKHRRRNGCRRRSLYVDFALIAYDEWIVAPPGYEAYRCAGKCFYPLAEHLSPTKHAIVQTLIHRALGRKKPGRACCVPTRLAPTSLLYLDAAGTLTYRYGYEDMVVAECGCR